MMRHRLIAAASQLQAAGAHQGFHQLLGSLTSAAAAARGGGALIAGPLASLGHAAAYSSSSAQHRGLRTLLPLAAAASQATAPCWRAAATGRRGYAQNGTRMPKSGYKAPVEMQRQMHLRMSMVASNLVAEPYRGPPASIPFAAYFTRDFKGWKELWNRFMGSVKSLYTLAKCKKEIPGFDRAAFKSEALSLYKEVCSQLAQGEKSALRQLVTPAVFSDMKRQLKQRDDGGWASVHWEVVREPTVREIQTVHGRLIMLDPKDASTGFAQMTVRIPSTQRFAAFDRAGQLVAGSLDQTIEVEDYWVFEHSLKKSAANRWRLAGRLAILPQAVKVQQAAAAAAADKASAADKAHAADAAAGAAAAGAGSKGQQAEPRTAQQQQQQQQQQAQQQRQWKAPGGGKKRHAGAGKGKAVKAVKATVP